MTNIEQMQTLKGMLEETDENARVLSDERLELLLEQCDGNLRKAAYEGALLKARCTGVSLPDGVTIESMRPYWLSIARVYRENRTQLAQRMDEDAV